MTPLESLLRSTIESADEGILVVDEKGRVVLHNARAAEMWNISNEMMATTDDRELIRHAIRQLTDPEGFLERAKAFDRTADTKTVDTLELKNGRIYERSSIPHRVGSAITGRVWKFRDITAEREAKRALERSEKRYRMLFERNLAGVYTCTSDGIITDCNPAFARMLGADSPAAIIGDRISKYHVAPAERQELTKMLGPASAIPAIELELRRMNGSELRVLEGIARVEIDGAMLFQSTVVDINDLKRAEEQIRFHAYHDVLTCLPNQQLFRDRVRVAIAHSSRSMKNAAVMFVDLDDFKKVNDTLGHTVGDEALVLLAERLTGVVRKGDPLARPGGDELRLLLVDLDSLVDVERVARKHLHIVAKPLTLGDRDIVLTASIGVAVFPADGLDDETLMKSADNALFAAKQMGRNTYSISSLELNRRTTERFIVENHLRTAIDHGEFEVHYQPVVDAKDHNIVALEALARWKHRERGLLQPIDFIRIAEETGLIVPLGELVLQRACADAAAWQLTGLENVRVAVNISQKQLQRFDFAEIVERVLRETGLPSHLLELEITESAAAEDPEATIAVLRRLRASGIRLSIDDIGTGYSSLAYLKHFPVTTVKVDKSFVNTITTDRSDAAIVAAVIGVAHSLDMEVVAEGVETDEQAAFLHHQRCNFLQGFRFGEPMRIDEWIGANNTAAQ